MSGWGENVNRFMIDGSEAGGRLSIVEHRVAPQTLPGPLHMHTREDEYSFVIEGRVIAVSNGTQVEARAGDLIFKPRDEWHAFWNPDETTLRILEIITPPGLEELFKKLGRSGELDPETLPAMGAEYGIELDFAGTQAIVETHGLSF
jgi:mannose-6-phosphate isomerase-like protein (cupin superfamily)